MSQMNPSQKVSQMMASKVDLSKPMEVGSYSNLHEKLVLELATAYQCAEAPDYVCVSWANQEKAQDYFNEHGFEATLDHMIELQGSLAQPDSRNTVSASV